METTNLEDSFLILLHDLRAPICTILALHELFGERLRTLDKEAELDYQETAEAACHKALFMINEWLENSKTATKEQTVKMAATNLNKLIESQMRVFSNRAYHRQIKVQSFLPAKDTVTFLDAAKFERCLENVLSNALKFTPENGKITLTMTIEYDIAKICIADTGIGIPEEMIPHLFKKFTPACRKGLNGETSLGLGLYSTKNLIELHQGNINVKSRPGKGTSFLLEIPVNGK